MCKDTNKVYFFGLMFLLSFCFYSCNEAKKQKQIERCFYYWKSNLYLSSLEKNKLDTLGVKTIFVKFFDIDWNSEKLKAMPIAKLTTNENSLASVRENKNVNRVAFSIIPTIFITNETFINIEKDSINSLVNNTYNLTTNLISQHAFDHIGGIQFDCDWTENTREKYFLFLQKFKTFYANTKMEISATIRLHQIKFMSKTGVPPIHKGMLMCYNMGNLKNPSTKNSIIEIDELKKYIANTSIYPLPLDVAVPLFEWNVLFRKNMYSGILRDFDSKKLSSSICKQEHNKFTFLKDTVVQDYTFYKDDVIRFEASDYKTIISAANLVSTKIKNTQLRVSLYHLDSVILTKYSTHELETIYNSMH